MSFLITSPEWIQSAAQDLASIRSALTEASAAAATSTATVLPAAADEVSSAIASFFGNLGQEYQRVSSQAQAFHAEFVKVLNSSGGAYLSAEVANAAQALGNSINGRPVAPPAEPVLGIPWPPGLPGMPAPPGIPPLPGLPSMPGFGSSTTGWSAFTGPYEQLVINTTANLQSLGNGLISNPMPVLRQFIANHTEFGGIVTTAVNNAMQELNSGGGGPQAAAAHLLPIANIPGEIGQNATNFARTVFDFSYSVGVDMAAPAVGPAFFGFPLALGLAVIGSPATTMSAMGSVAASFATAMQTGDFIGAAAAVFTAPAVVVNGFLNGQTTMGMALPPMMMPFGQAPMTFSVPLGGLITPMSVTSVLFGPTGGAIMNPQMTIPLGGTTIGGLLPAFLNWAPQQLAQAIGAAIPPQLPAPIPTLEL